MSRLKYLNELESILKQHGVDDYNGIVNDYNELFNERVMKGHSEPEIIEELGPVSELASNYYDGAGTGKSKNNSKQESQTNVALFILLQIFNFMLGIALIFSAWAIVISIIIVILVSIFATAVVIFAVLNSSIPVFIFSILLLIIISICCVPIIFKILETAGKLTINYIIFNVNTLKSKKVSYYKFKLNKKLYAIVLATLVVTSVVFSASSGVWVFKSIDSIKYANFEVIDAEIKDEFESIEFYGYKTLSNIQLGNIMYKSGVDVEILPSETNYIKVHSSESDSENIEYHVKNNTLVVDFKDLKSLYNKNIYRVEIGSTANLKDVNIKATNVNIKDVNIENLSIDSRRTELTLTENEITTLDIDTAELILKTNTSTIKEADIDAANSILDITSSIINNIDIDAASSENTFDTVKFNNVTIDAANVTIDGKNTSGDKLDFDGMNLELDFDEVYITNINLDGMNVEVSHNNRENIATAYSVNAMNVDYSISKNTIEWTANSLTK